MLIYQSSNKLTGMLKNSISDEVCTINLHSKILHLYSSFSSIGSNTPSKTIASSFKRDHATSFIFFLLCFIVEFYEIFHLNTNPLSLGMFFSLAFIWLAFTNSNYSIIWSNLICK